MSTPILKLTKCDGFCDFNKIASYCFDCPALMCNECKVSMHTNIEDHTHKIINFRNASLNWNDKKFIMGIFKDKSLAERVYVEVSRRKELTNTIGDFVDEIGYWQCQACIYNCNPISSNKCDMCYSFRNTEIIGVPNEDYNMKVEKFEEDVFKSLLEFDKQMRPDNAEIPYENIMYCYYVRARKDLTLLEWYRMYYPKRKSLAILNKILEERGHTIRMNELDRHYNDMAKQENNKLLMHIPEGDTKNSLSRENELIEPNDVNKNNKLPSNILNNIVTEDQIWNVIVKKEKLNEHDMRKLLIELVLDSESKIDALNTYVSNEELREYLERSYKSKNMTLLHLKEAISCQLTIDSAFNFLKNECEICSDDYPLSEIFSLITCEHKFCKSCTLGWLKETIISKYPSEWNCPSCTEDKFNRIDKHLYYSHLRRILVDDKILLNAFEEKLLKDQLRKSPYFHWCANEKCVNGFEAEGAHKIQCPTCHQYMCVTCNRSWVKEHEDKTCQEFELWILNNDPNRSNLFKNIGIECPNCGMRYALAAGGCLHFGCKACKVQFCGGCYQLFVDKCDKPNCKMTGFHGHHPRNCLYYLRDYDVIELENMLKTIDYPKLQNKPEKNCLIMITDNEFKEHLCDKDVFHTTGMCEIHFKEYLSQFINRYKIDPAGFVNVEKLNLMLFQMVLPQLQKSNAENDVQFKERLKKEVIDNCLFYVPKFIRIG